MVKVALNPPPTQRQIADQAGVSRETVSHILGGNQAKRYSEETRRKVMLAAQDLGYHPNRLARAMRQGRSGLIGIVQPGFHLELTRRALLHLPPLIREGGYRTLPVEPTLHTGQTVQDLIGMRVEGVILFMPASSTLEEYAAPLRKANIPVVSIYARQEAVIPSVQMGLHAGYRTLTQHLLELGHRRLLLLLGKRPTTAAGPRRTGFHEALAPHGPVESCSGDAFLEQWPRLARRRGVAGYCVHLEAENFFRDPAHALNRYGSLLFRSGPLPDAILCSNDQGALGLISAAMENGISIPEQMAMTGTDNDLFTSLPAFSLTTLDLEVEQACQLGVKMLLKLIRGERLPRKHPVIFPTLIVRRSCGTPSSMETRRPIKP